MYLKLDESKWYRHTQEWSDRLEGTGKVEVYKGQIEVAADVAPVVHAHWKEYVDVGGAIYVECSKCGLVWWLDEGTAEENEMFYCPKCCAKMDEEQ